MKFELTYLPDVVTLELDAAKCNGCQMCVIVCPHAVFEMQKKRAVIINRDSCMECGACAINCEPGAISVDSGVGCASAIIKGIVTGSEPKCGCDDGNSSNNCCS